MPRLVIDIVGDTAKLSRAYRDAERQTRGFQSRMGRLLKVGAFAAGGAAVTGFAVALKAGFDEMLAGEKVAADTAAALKSTGHIAGVSAKQIDELAKSMQRLTGYDDEAVASAENLLLTFTNIRNVAGKNNDVFTQTLSSTLDLSRRFDQDLTTSAVQLGKALQDPVKGVTALRRIGVSFTADQVKLIKRLVETGRLLEAQKVILREVRVETGGAAEAYGKTMAGQLDILQGNLENLAGELVETLNPEVKKLTGQFNKWLENPENKQKVIDGFATAVHGLGEAFQFAADTAGFLKDAWDKIPNWLPGKNEGLLDLLGITGGDKFGGGGDFGPGGRPVGTGRSRGGAARPGRAAPVDVPYAGQWLDLGRAMNKWIRAGKEAAAAIKAQKAVEAALRLETKLGWLEFGLERAEATTKMSDDRAWLKKIEAYWKERIRHEGRKLDLVQELWRTQQRIRDLNKKNADVDPLAGLMQVSSKRMANMLAAGTGLSVAGRRTLGANIAGLEMRPIYVAVNVDGRELGRVVVKDQARTGRRTARQTSGFRG